MGGAFRFGDNWGRFLDRLEPPQIDAARGSLVRLLGREDLRGLGFLDVGCGSGLFSLAARQLGAEVCSLDADPGSVACAERLRAAHASGEAGWRVKLASALHPETLRALGAFDIVYAWGVLHHTGALWPAMDNVAQSVRPGGCLVVSLYNDQGWISGYWALVKRAYNHHAVLRGCVIGGHLPYLALRWAARAATGRLAHERGMSLWRDYLDWLGGWPFQPARPEAVVRFLSERGFSLRREILVKEGRHGCNEFVFDRAAT